MALSTGPVERKTKVAALVTYLGSVAALAVIDAVGELDILAGAPGWLQVIVAPALPAALAAAGAWFARHTHRTDPDAGPPSAHLTR